MSVLGHLRPDRGIVIAGLGSDECRGVDVVTRAENRAHPFPDA
jgi:hypothetical protein